MVNGGVKLAIQGQKLQKLDLGSLPEPSTRLASELYLPLVHLRLPTEMLPNIPRLVIHEHETLHSQRARILLREKAIR
jgi:hypothetical protein